MIFEKASSGFLEAHGEVLLSTLALLEKKQQKQMVWYSTFNSMKVTDWTFKYKHIFIGPVIIPSLLCIFKVDIHCMASGHIQEP